MRYEAPASLDAATRLLADAGGAAKVLAGGTDLLIQMRGDLVEPEILVDIKNIAEMREIAEEDGRFRLGPAVTGMEIHGARGIQRRVAGHRRRRQADRLDPDTRPGDAGRKPVQRLARRRQRAGADRRRCGRLGDRSRGTAFGPGGRHRHRPGPDLAEGPARS